MKKVFTLISIFSVSVTWLFAQATPNAGFENWTTSGFPSHTDPDSWDCANPETAITGVITVIKAAAPDIYSGTAAAKLVTKQIPAPFNQIVPGMVTTGTINTSTQIIEAGIPYTLRPDSIIGWYKYTPQGAENGFIGFNLYGSAANNTDTIAKAGFATPTVTVGAYTRFSAPLVYTTSTNPVANSMWIAASSNNNALASSIGSTLFIDDLGLVFNPTTAVNELNTFDVTVGPNPVVDHIAFKNTSDSKAIFVLYDVTGRNIAAEEIQNSAKVIDATAFPAGLYIYSVSDENNTVIKSGKLIIQK